MKKMMLTWLTVASLLMGVFRFGNVGEGGRIVIL